MAKEYEVTVAGLAFKAESWKALALALAAAPEVAAALAAPAAADAAACPTYTLRADVGEHAATLYGMARAAREIGSPLRAELEAAAREFELWRP